MWAGLCPKQRVFEAAWLWLPLVSSRNEGSLKLQASWCACACSKALLYMHCPSMQLNVGRMLACARCKLWWMTPEWRSSTLELPPETQFLLAELPAQMQATGEEQSAGGYALILPLIDWDFRATLRAGRYVVGMTQQGCAGTHTLPCVFLPRLMRQLMLP